MTSRARVVSAGLAGWFALLASYACWISIAPHEPEIGRLGAFIFFGFPFSGLYWVTFLLGISTAHRTLNLDRRPVASLMNILLSFLAGLILASSIFFHDLSDLIFAIALFLVPALIIFLVMNFSSLVSIMRPAFEAGDSQ